VLLDLLLTIVASIVIGWNMGTWLVPAYWLVILSLAAIIIKASTAKVARRPNERPRQMQVI
jgi:hypothetical protein